MQQFKISPTNVDPQAPKITLLPGTTTPRLGPRKQLENPSFWDNLKDFLTERPINVPDDANQEVFRRDGLDNSFSDSVKAFFSPAARRAKGAPTSGMEVDWQPEWRVFWNNLRDTISPPKLPPLKLTSKPVKVRPIWAKREEFSLSQGISIGLHVLLALVILVPIVHKVVQAQPSTTVNIGLVDVSPYLSKLPPARPRRAAAVAAANACRSPRRAGSCRSSR